MTTRKLIALALLLALLAPTAAAAMPAPSTLASPCTSGAAYDPACDVDHDGDVDVVDVQLAASHWNQSGVWTGGDFWSLTGNASTTPATHFLGTTDNQALELRVGGQRALKLDWTGLGASPNLLGGYFGNVISPTVVGGTIAGGGLLNGENKVLASYGAVGGGNQNTAGGNAATVGGGSGNTANATVATVGGGQANTASADEATVSGGRANTASASDATVGGGQANTASGYAATVGGGLWNAAGGHLSTVGGGTFNIASGPWATVPGGYSNLAQGGSSLAAGTWAAALHNGAFVWADDHAANFASTGANQFLVRANGGVGINTNAPARSLDVNGVVGVFDGGTRTYFGGLATELGGQLIEMGMNDDASNRFGGVYNPAAQGGLFRVNARTDADLFQFYGRAAGSTSLQSLALLNSSGVLSVSGGFHGACRTDGNVAGGPYCNMDVAEVFATNEPTEPGDVVALALQDTTAPTVRRATGERGELLLGVVSTNPGLVFEDGTTRLSGDNSQLITAQKTVVAVLGRVPVRVSLANGPIAVGDPLTASATPGAAMKATHAGQIIGYALQGSDETQDGKVLMWLQAGVYLPAEMVARLNAASSGAQNFAKLEEQNAALEVRLAALEQALAKDAPRSAGRPASWLLLGGLLVIGAVFTQRSRR